MSVTLQTPYNIATGNAVSTVFPYQFLLLAATDLSVYVDGALKTNVADYSVSGVGVTAGGNVTFVTAPATGTQVSLIRTMRRERLTDYQQAGDFLTSVVNPDFDRAILIAQDEAVQLQRSIRTPASEVSASFTLPAASVRANTYITFDSSGNISLATSLPSGTLSQATIGGFLYPRTAAEIAAGVTPTNYAYPPGDIRRYGGIDDDGTDNATAINNAILVGGTIQFPVTNTGVYRTSGGHTLADGVSLRGWGMRTGAPYRGSGLKLTANATMFVLTARNLVEDLEFSTTTTATPFTAAGKALSIGTGATFAGLCVIRRCRIFNFDVGIKNGGALWGTVQDCTIINNNYGITYDMSGAITSNAMVYINNYIGLNQRGGVVGISMPVRGIGHNFIGGSIEANCQENVVTYPAQVRGLTCGQISFKGVYFEYANGAVAAPNFINSSGMADGSIEDCYFNISTSTSGTGIYDIAAGTSKMFIRNNRFLGGSFTNDVNLVSCTQMRLLDNNHSVAASVVTGTGSQIITTRLAPTITREGTWTPTLRGTSTAGAQTYSVQVGFYTQIDNVVHVRCRITMTAKDGATAGNLQIAGLPFAQITNPSGHTTFVLAVENLTQSALRTQFVGRLTSAASEIDIMESGSNVTLLATVVGNLNATTSVYMTGSYIIANPT